MTTFKAFCTYVLEQAFGSSATPQIVLIVRPAYALHTITIDKICINHTIERSTAPSSFSEVGARPFLVRIGNDISQPFGSGITIFPRNSISELQG